MDVREIFDTPNVEITRLCTEVRNRIAGTNAK